MCGVRPQKPLAVAWVALRLVQSRGIPHNSGLSIPFPFGNPTRCPDPRHSLTQIPFRHRQTDGRVFLFFSSSGPLAPLSEAELSCFPSQPTKRANQPLASRFTLPRQGTQGACQSAGPSPAPSTPESVPLCSQRPGVHGWDRGACNGKGSMP